MTSPKEEKTYPEGREGEDSGDKWGKSFIELKALYNRVDGEAPPPLPPCRQDGACCRFSSSGLKLFASSIEIAYLLHQAGPPGKAVLNEDCPYLEGDLCSAREGRTLGCRLYHCGSETDDGSTALYEKFHKEIAELHEKHDIDYVYSELLSHPILRKGGRW